MITNPGYNSTTEVFIFTKSSANITLQHCPTETLAPEMPNINWTVPTVP